MRPARLETHACTAITTVHVSLFESAKHVLWNGHHKATVAGTDLLPVWKVEQKRGEIRIYIKTSVPVTKFRCCNSSKYVSCNSHVMATHVVLLTVDLFCGLFAGVCLLPLLGGFEGVCDPFLRWQANVPG